MSQRRLYVGIAGRLRPGDILPAGAALRYDPAAALAAAWRDAEQQRGRPHVYRISSWGGTAVIQDAILIDAALAIRALRLQASHHRPR